MSILILTSSSLSSPSKESWFSREGVVESNLRFECDFPYPSKLTSGLLNTTFVETNLGVVVDKSLCEKNGRSLKFWKTLTKTRSFLVTLLLRS